MILKKENLSNQKITVLGAARSGLAVSELLKTQGAQVFVSDMADASSMQDAVQFLENHKIHYEMGGHSDRIYDANAWIISPGIPIDHPMVIESKARGIRVVGELEAASWFCKSEIIAVTGSNGKSTTTALIGEIFKADNRPVVVAGNIGRSFASVVEKTGEGCVAVLEVSSFQLETIDHFHPGIALLLNLSPDHLDRHGDMEQYGKMKARLFENQDHRDYTVYNSSDYRIRGLAASTKAEKAEFSRPHTRFPCTFTEQGVIYIQREGRKQAVVSLNEMQLVGEHNQANAEAAVLGASLLGASINACRTALQRFRSLEHRMESVGESGEILWINDSKGTNTDSTWYALGSFTRPVILIAGGKDKDSDFSLLNDRIREHVKLLILIGDAADKMEKTFKGLTDIQRAATLKDAVDRAEKAAKPGDVVLLSPACASFDMFSNFEDRGQQFKSLVRDRL